MHNGEGCPLAKGSGIVVWSAAFNAQWWGPEAGCSSLLESDCLRSSCIATVACGRPWRRSPATGCMPVSASCMTAKEAVTRVHVIRLRVAKSWKMFNVENTGIGIPVLSTYMTVKKISHGSTKHRILRISISDRNIDYVSRQKNFTG